VPGGIEQLDELSEVEFAPNSEEGDLVGATGESEEIGHECFARCVHGKRFRATANYGTARWLLHDWNAPLRGPGIELRGTSERLDIAPPATQRVQQVPGLVDEIGPVSHL
jgi:hypothetical protein